MILNSLQRKSDVIRVQASQYQVLETSPVVTPMSTHAFYLLVMQESGSESMKKTKRLLNLLTST